MMLLSAAKSPLASWVRLSERGGRCRPRGSCHSSWGGGYQPEERQATRMPPSWKASSAMSGAEPLAAGKERPPGDPAGCRALGEHGGLAVPLPSNKR